MASPPQLQAYQLLTKLATGGYCDIWLAKQRGPMGFERQCAVKTLRPEFVHEESARKSFMAEARLLAKLDHPNVIALFELGQDPRSGALFFAMPFVRGRTLTKLVQRGKETPYWGVAEALWIGARLFDALAHVHELSDPVHGRLHIVHRDISPENIMVSHEGKVRLIDFGIALSALTSRHTLNHRVKGKLQFLSPEQARGEELDQRSDIYSAGLTLYLMLAGQDALQATDLHEALERAQRPQIQPLHQLVELPHELSTLTMAMLSPDRDRRPSHARELRVALLSLLHKFYPSYTAQFFEDNIARILHHERLQDEALLANTSVGTQVIHDLGEEDVEDDEPSPMTTELEAEELAEAMHEERTLHDLPALPSAQTRGRRPERTVPDLPAFDPSGLPTRSQALDDVLNALETLYLPSSSAQHDDEPT